MNGRFQNVALGVLIALFFALLSFWFEENAIDVKWLSLTVETGLVFGLSIGILKHLWKRPVFWLSLACFPIVHLAVFRTVLQGVREWRGASISGAFVLETSIVIGLCELLSRAIKTRQDRR
jgi:urea transporter